MQVQAVTFTAPWQVEWKARAFEPGTAETRIVLETEYSIVSAGTELAILSGTEGWAPLPFVPGYGAVGIVREVGSAVTGFRVGERIFTFSPHQTMALAEGVIAKVPEDLDPVLAPFQRIVEIAITAVRVSNVELGDWVAVLGLGLVGNLAAQLMQLAGATVIGVDTSPPRRATARACGIECLIDPKETDLPAAVREITGGEMCHTIVEATGIPSMTLTAAELGGAPSEVILLGTPRGEFQGSAADLLRLVHLAPNCVTLKGAHEWRYPRHDPSGTAKHTIERNVKQGFEMLRKEKLKVRELLTHVRPPSQAPEVYAQLRARNEDYFGVVFDWTQEREV